MTDVARTRFQALVDLWRIQSDGTLDLERGRLLNRCADELSALLVQEEGRTEWKAAPDAVERESSTRKDELKPAPSVKEQDAPEILLVQEAPQEEEKRALDELDALAQRPDLRQQGWDSYSANPLDDRAIDAARRFLRYSWAVVPTVNGGIQLERHHSGFDMEIEFDEEGKPESVYAELYPTGEPGSGLRGDPVGETWTEEVRATENRSEPQALSPDPQIVVPEAESGQALDLESIKTRAGSGSATTPSWKLREDCWALIDEVERLRAALPGSGPAWQGQWTVVGTLVPPTTSGVSDDGPARAALLVPAAPQEKP